MAQIDRSVVNFENLTDETGTPGATSKTGSSRRAGFGKKKAQQGPWLAKTGGMKKGPSSKQSKATKTSGKFGAKSEGRAQGKGNNSKIR